MRIQLNSGPDRYARAELREKAEWVDSEDDPAGISGDIRELCERLDEAETLLTVQAKKIAELEASAKEELIAAHSEVPG
jgi:hypothetical protein